MKSRLFYPAMAVLVLLSALFAGPLPSITPVGIALTGPDQSWKEGVQPDEINIAPTPKLDEFILSVTNGEGDELVGVFAPNTFALRVVKQPSGSPGYASSEPDTLTLFGLAQQYGSTGMLSHNYPAGENLNRLLFGQEAMIIHGDGSVQRFNVTDIQSYQSLPPSNPYSNFVDLSDQRVLSSTELFLRVYANEGQLVFQTCIERHGPTDWSRLFVLASPAETTSSWTDLFSTTL